MKRPNDLRVGDKFEVLEDCTYFRGSIIELVEDDLTDACMYRIVSGPQLHLQGCTEAYCNFMFLKPWTVPQNRLLEVMEALIDTAAAQTDLENVYKSDGEAVSWPEVWIEYRKLKQSAGVV